MYTLAPSSTVILQDDSAELSLILKRETTVLKGGVSQVNEPVGGAEIRLGELSTKSDENGNFQLEIPLVGSISGGTVEVRISGEQRWRGYLRLPYPGRLEIPLP